MEDRGGLLSLPTPHYPAPRRQYLLTILNFIMHLSFSWLDRGVDAVAQVCAPMTVGSEFESNFMFDILIDTKFYRSTL